MYAFCFLSRLSRHSYLTPHQDKEEDGEFEDVDEDVDEDRRLPKKFRASNCFWCTPL